MMQAKTDTAAPVGNHFANYLEMTPRVPQWFWWVLRVLTLAATLGFMAFVLVRPATGLELFWKAIVPSLPIVFAVVPGFWRQVCPMALSNQIPRVLGFSLNKTLPLAAKSSLYLVSVLIFFLLVTLRHVFFNTDADALVLLMAAALLLPFIGGMIYKGRSGWCGTLCPLAPIQKAYGQAPLLLVRNGFCPSCVGCQKHCYDFNPRASMHSDLDDADDWYAGHREFFVAALPGLMVGFFTTNNLGGMAQLPSYLGYMGLCMAVSLGLFMAATRIVRISRYRAVLIAAMTALVIFYWYASPAMTGVIAKYAGVRFLGVTRYAFFALAFLIAARVLQNGLQSEFRFKEKAQPAEPRAAVRADVLRDVVDGSEPDDLVADRGSGKNFAADSSRSLLEGLESVGVQIDFGCRMGVCGADPVAIIDGHECLSEASGAESETLRRLGLEGRARMACVCRADRGGVVLDTTLDPKTLPAPTPKTPAVDLGKEASVGRVVIIGNGAAGATAASEVRRLSPSCEIDVIAREPEHFYNRMAIGRLLYGRTALHGLQFHSPEWMKQNDVDVWLNTSAVAIDRDARSIRLGTGDDLSYDKLILAQGSRAMMPPLAGSELPGCFVLREASDAMAIRAWRQAQRCRSAVVVGGGVLGIEAADALRRLNLEVTILQRGPRLMDRQLDEKASAILAGYLEGLGMRIVTNAAVRGCAGTDKLAGVELEDGELIEAQVLVACAGIQPNVEIAAAAGLEVGRGIKVDRLMRTSDPDIFAIGDVAELPGAISGLWAVSTAQASVAAHAVFGKETDYSPPNTLVSLKMEGIDVKGYGVVAPGPEHDVVVNSEEPEDEHRLLVLEGDQIVGAVFVGPPGIGRHLSDLIDKNPDITPMIAEELKHGNWNALETIL